MRARSFLEGLGLERYAPAFEENDIDDDALATLTDGDLQTLGVASLGHRKKILKALSSAATDAPPVSSAPPPAAPPAAGAVSPSRATSGMTKGAPQELARSFPRELLSALTARGYVLVDRIGAGGMGEVFLAQQTSVGRDVAIKVLARGSSEGDRARFAREARAIAALQHPHVVRFYDYVMEGDGACIVMEHVVGQSLSALFAHEGRIPFERMVPIAMQICDALSEAHAKGIVHRDLKPANILLQEAEGYREFARVLDFGLAHWVAQDESRLTRTGTVYGTPRYLSPEQIVGSAITPRSDLYALGVILYEGLAGRPPFGGEVDAALLFRHLKETAPPLPDDVERPRALDGIVARMLAKAPTLRPASAAALRRELAALFATPSGATKIAGPLTPSGPVTERRHVVVLDVSFLDRAHLPPSPDVAHTLARQGQSLVDAIARRTGGTLTARSAHGATLVFGAPVARKGDLDRALGAALELRSALAAMDTTYARPRIGVADGGAVSGGLREGPDAGYFVSGAPVDAAEALRGGAVAGQVRISRSIALREPGGFAIQSLADTDASLLLGRAEHTTARERPFVGREEELGAISTVLDGALPGTAGAIVVVSGEAGIGKSRFVDRALALAHGHAMRSVRGQLFDVDVASADDALHQIVRELLSLPEDATNRAAAIERRLGPDALRAEEWPFLYHYLGVSLPGPMQRLYDAMDPGARASGYRDMLVSLFAHESREQPLVIVIEDLHWADGPMLEVLELCATLTLSQPIVLLLTSRVEEEERWKHVLVGHPTTRIELAPLEADDIETLAALLGVGEADRAGLAKRAAGHPMLLTELARHVHDASGALPDSVQGLVHARVDRLPELDRLAIASAAVLGPRFKLGDLREVMARPDYVPTTLVEHRLVRREDDGTFVFSHGLVREAVYESLVEERRRGLHEKAATSMRGTPALVAMHLDRAGSPAAARAYLDTALAEITRHELVSAREHLVRGVAAAHADADRLELHEARGGVELALGESKAALASFEAMRAVATKSADVHRAEIGLASALRAANRWEEAIAALDRAEAAAADARLSIAQARYLRGGIEFARGRVADSQAAHEEALALATKEGSVELRTQALSGLADAHYGAGRLVTAARTWTECVAIARREKLLAVEAVNLPMLGIVQVFLNESERALTTSADAIALAQSLSRTRAEALGRGGAALSAAVRGDGAAALLHATRGHELTKKLGHIVFEETVLYYMALAQVALGDEPAARDSVDRALALARKHGMGFVGATLLAAKARLGGSPEERVALLAEGEALARAGRLSFDRFWFYENAIEAALALGDAPSAHRYAEEIVRTEEPLPWAEVVAARGHALAAHLEHATSEATRTALETALAGTRAAGLRPAAVALERALGHARNGSGGPGA